MKNLENYGVQELNAMEINDVNGGFLGLGVVCVILAVAYIAGTVAGISSGQHVGGMP